MEGVVSSDNPESQAGCSIAKNRVSQAGQVKRMKKILRYHDLNVLETENNVITHMIAKFTASQRTQFISFIQKTHLMLFRKQFMLIT
jgi:hypothetical protein